MLPFWGLAAIPQHLHGATQSIELPLYLALDFGLLGLCLFGYLLMTAIKAVRVTSTTADHRRILCAGLIGSIVTYCVFGLVDAVAVGAKPTFIPWAVLALAVSLRQPKPSNPVRNTDSARLIEGE